MTGRHGLVLSRLAPLWARRHGIFWPWIVMLGKIKLHAHKQVSLGCLAVRYIASFLHESRGRWSKRASRIHSSQGAGDAADSTLKISRAGEWDGRRRI